MVSRRPAIIARLVRTPRPSRNAKPIATRTEMRFLMSDQRAQQIHRRDDALDHFPALVVDDDQAAEPKMEKQLGRLGERRVGLDTARRGAHDVAHERTAPPRRADRARRADGETGASRAAASRPALSACPAGPRPSRPYGSSAGPLAGRGGGRLRGRPPTAVRMARPGCRSTVHYRVLSPSARAPPPALRRTPSVRFLLQARRWRGCGPA